MVPLALGPLRTKVIDGSVKMAKQKVDGTLTKIHSSMEAGGAMITVKEENGLLRMQHLILKLLRSLSISKLAPGSVQMVPLKVLGNSIQ